MKITRSGLVHLPEEEIFALLEIRKEVLMLCTYQSLKILVYDLHKREIL